MSCLGHPAGRCFFLLLSSCRHRLHSHGVREPRRCQRLPAHRPALSCSLPSAADSAAHQHAGLPAHGPGQDPYCRGGDAQLRALVPRGEGCLSRLVHMLPGRPAVHAPLQAWCARCLPSLLCTLPDPSADGALVCPARRINCRPRDVPAHLPVLPPSMPAGQGGVFGPHQAFGGAAGGRLPLLHGHEQGRVLRAHRCGGQLCRAHSAGQTLCGVVCWCAVLSPRRGSNTLFSSCFASHHSCVTSTVLVALGEQQGTHPRHA